MIALNPLEYAGPGWLKNTTVKALIDGSIYNKSKAMQIDHYHTK